MPRNLETAPELTPVKVALSNMTVGAEGKAKIARPGCRNILLGGR